jgi:hypothetical protein
VIHVRIETLKHLDTFRTIHTKRTGTVLSGDNHGVRVVLSPLIGRQDSWEEEKTLPRHILVERD